MPPSPIGALSAVPSSHEWRDPQLHIPPWPWLRPEPVAPFSLRSNLELLSTLPCLLLWARPRRPRPDGSIYSGPCRNARTATEASSRWCGEARVGQRSAEANCRAFSRGYAIRALDAWEAANGLGWDGERYTSGVRSESFGKC